MGQYKRHDQEQYGTTSNLPKWLTILIACIVCFVVGINGTAVLSPVTEITSQFSIDEKSFSYSYFLVTA
jgi:hypothetical protein